MAKRRNTGDRVAAIIAASGGADSVYLLDLSRRTPQRLLVGHYNHGARGKESEADERFVEWLCRGWGLPLKVGRPQPEAPVSRIAGRKGRAPSRFEEKARTMRYAFLKDLKAGHNAEKIVVAHTADDQVETILMRVLEGAGIAGLKGIPRKTRDGIERPILDEWRDDILKYLKKHKIPYRVDTSNFDTRFERNWIRHVLIPLLEKRYGKSVKKRIFALGERLREIDRFLETMARNWMSRNLRAEAGGGETSTGFLFRRNPFGKLPSELRIRILQILCFEKAVCSPNERLLASMDRLILSGSPSASLAIGNEATLSCSYGDARLTPVKGGSRKRTWEPVLIPGPGLHEFSRSRLRWEEERGRMSASAIRKRSAGEQAVLLDAGELRLPLAVRPLRFGDRVRPFGMDAEKKVKEILIDRKVPREERWGRPVVCDADGTILWIPGLIRSAFAPVTPRTRRTIRLGLSDRDA